MNQGTVRDLVTSGQAILELIRGASFLKKIEDRQVYLGEMLSEMSAPLQLLVMGEFSTGKSTFINALLGEDVTAVGALPTTAVYTKLVYGEYPSVVAHFKDGSTQEYGLDEFDQLTAETNKRGEKLRTSILRVERRVPAEILKQINIIDSPGLNAQDSHTEITKEAIPEADAVLWMFDAGTTGKASEIESLGSLPTKLMPIAIVNKMDMVDEEEDDPERLIQDIERKLKGKVQCVIPISAQMALMGKQKKSKQLLAESNITAVERMITGILPARHMRENAERMMESVAILLYDADDVIDDYIYAAKIMKSAAEYQEAQDETQLLSGRIGTHLKELLRCADGMKESAGAQLLHAVGHLHGIGGISEDKEKFEQYLKQAALLESLPAEARLAKHLLDKEDDTADQWAKSAVQRAVDSDVLRSVQGLAYYVRGKIAIRHGNVMQGLGFYKQAADSGYAKAANEAGWIYQHGEGVDASPTAAFACYQYAAEHGIPAGKNNLAYMYSEGLGTPKNLILAMVWYRAGANDNDASAQCNLAWMYLYGEGIEKNPQEALKWFSYAAAQEHIDAKEEMAKLYSGTEGIAPNYAKAAELFEAVFKARKDPEASLMGRLGSLYLTGGDGLARNATRALYWLDRAAQAGDEAAQGKLMQVYRDGASNIDVDHKRAAQYAEQFLNGKKQNHRHDMYLLGRMYLDGKYGLNRSLIHARAWLRSAASLGDRDAAGWLAATYWDPQYTPQPNFAQAAKILEDDFRNVDMPLPSLMRTLGLLYDEGGHYLKKNDEKALHWLARAASCGDAEAQYAVGCKYAEGEGVEPDADRARAYLTAAAQQGYRTAIDEVAFREKMKNCASVTFIKYLSISYLIKIPIFITACLLIWLQYSSGNVIYDILDWIDYTSAHGIKIFLHSELIVYPIIYAMSVFFILKDYSSRHEAFAEHMAWNYKRDESYEDNVTAAVIGTDSGWGCFSILLYIGALILAVNIR